MIKVFFDCESSGLHKDNSLISLGMVSDEGHTFYAELNDYDEPDLDWFSSNFVIPNLKFGPPLSGQQEHFVWLRRGSVVEVRGNVNEVAMYVADWFQDIQGGPVSWINYGDEIQKPELVEGKTIELWSDFLSYNFVLFCELFGGVFHLPECVNHIPFDLATVFKLAGIAPDENRDKFAGWELGSEENNALWDARVIQKCYSILCEETGLSNVANQ